MLKNIKQSAFAARATGFAGHPGWKKSNNLNNLNKAMRAGLTSHGGTENMANNLNNLNKALRVGG